MYRAARPSASAHSQGAAGAAKVRFLHVEYATSIGRSWPDGMRVRPSGSPQNGTFACSILRVGNRLLIQTVNATP